MSFDKCKDVWVFISDASRASQRAWAFKVGAVIHPIAMSYMRKGG